MKKKVVKRNSEKQIQKERDPSQKQFAWLVIFFVVVILLAIVGPTVYHRLFNVFDYGGVRFEKTKFSNTLYFYHGVFPVIYKGNLTGYYNAYFRTDPRKNNISIETETSLSRSVIVSLSPGVEKCESMPLGQQLISQFISSFTFVKNLSGGLADPAMAKELNVSFVNCKNSSIDKTVFIIQTSEVPSVAKGNGTNCYLLNIGDCQYLETIERYVMSAMAQINNVSVS